MNSNEQMPDAGLSHKAIVVKEQLHTNKEIIETGKIDVFKKVFEDQFTQDVSVIADNIVIERRPMGNYIDDVLPVIRYEGNTTIIPVLKEVIIKRVLLVEEVYITKQVHESTVTVNESTRREEVIVERRDG